MNAFVISLLVYFVLRHYWGYDIDGALYLLQTVQFLHPERFASDAQFMFGNQGGFSLFNPLCAVFFKLFSVNAGGVLFTFALQLSACIAVVFFLKPYLSFFSKSKKKLAVATGIAVALYSQTSYGCGDDFRMSIFEPFLVARLASQVFILWGLVFFCSKKNIALALFLLATAMHPITGGWALFFWILFYYSKLGIALVFMALAFPMSGFLHIDRLDFLYDDWLVRPLYMIPTANDWFDYFSLFACFVIFALTFKDEIAKKISICLSIITIVVIYLQIVASYGEHIFLYQLQPFRFIWLGVIMLLPLLWKFFKEQIDSNEFGNRIALVVTSALAIQVLSIHQSICVPLLAIVLFFICEKFVSAKIFQNVCCSLIFLLVFSITIFDYAFDFNVFSFVYSFVRYTTVLEIMPLLKKSVFMLCILMFLFKVRQREWGLAVLFLICSCFENAELLQLFVLTFMYNKPLALFFSRLFQERRTWWVATLLLFLCAIFFWDTRDEYRRNIESNMDRYLDTTIFPQIADRGKIFFFIDNEGPISSRFRFLTGGYIDKVFHIGEAFFYEQYKEATRRKNLFAYGKESFEPIGQAVFEETLNRIYGNLDSLNNRLDLLCSKNEIMYIATDRDGLTGIAIDSMNIENGKRILLKKCIP